MKKLFSLVSLLLLAVILTFSTNVKAGCPALKETETANGYCVTMYDANGGRTYSCVAPENLTPDCKKGSDDESL